MPPSVSKHMWIREEAKRMAWREKKKKEGL